MVFWNINYNGNYGPSSRDSAIRSISCRRYVGVSRYCVWIMIRAAFVSLQRVCVYFGWIFISIYFSWLCSSIFNMFLRPLAISSRSFEFNRTRMKLCVKKRQTRMKILGKKNVSDESIHTDCSHTSRCERHTDSFHSETDQQTAIDFQLRCVAKCLICVMTIVIFATEMTANSHHILTDLCYVPSYKSSVCRRCLCYFL